MFHLRECSSPFLALLNGYSRKKNLKKEMQLWPIAGSIKSMADRTRFRSFLHSDISVKYHNVFRATVLKRHHQCSLCQAVSLENNLFHYLFCLSLQIVSDYWSKLDFTRDGNCMLESILSSGQGRDDWLQSFYPLFLEHFEQPLSHRSRLSDFSRSSGVDAFLWWGWGRETNEVDISSSQQWFNN